ncbi:hypothetical protein T484DRAFT_1881050, partial [Baffinella frigidus]
MEPDREMRGAGSQALLGPRAEDAYDEYADFFMGAIPDVAKDDAMSTIISPLGIENAPEPNAVAPGGQVAGGDLGERLERSDARGDRVGGVCVDGVVAHSAGELAAGHERGSCDLGGMGKEGGESQRREEGSDDKKGGGVSPEPAPPGVPCLDAPAAPTAPAPAMPTPPAPASPSLATPTTPAPGCGLSQDSLQGSAGPVGAPHTASWPPPELQTPCSAWPATPPPHGLQLPPPMGHDTRTSPRAPPLQTPCSPWPAAPYTPAGHAWPDTPASSNALTTSGATDEPAPPGVLGLDAVGKESGGGAGGGGGMTAPGSGVVAEGGGAALPPLDARQLALDLKNCADVRGLLDLAARVEEFNRLHCVVALKTTQRLCQSAAGMTDKTRSFVEAVLARTKTLPRLSDPSAQMTTLGVANHLGVAPSPEVLREVLGRALEIVRRLPCDRAGTLWAERALVDCWNLNVSTETELVRTLRGYLAYVARQAVPDWARHAPAGAPAVDPRSVQAPPPQHVSQHLSGVQAVPPQQGAASEGRTYRAGRGSFWAQVSGGGGEGAGVVAGSGGDGQAQRREEAGGSDGVEAGLHGVAPPWAPP